MNVVAVIPARFGSTRFPAKMLACETGKFLMQHVYEGVCSSRRVTRTVVATDDERIMSAVRSFGGEALLTRDDHPSGTSRVTEVAASLGLAPEDLVLNVQGDEPEITGAVLDPLIARMTDSSNDYQIGTVATPFPKDAPRTGSGSPADPNRVKVVLDHGGRALYFSRSLIPFPRDVHGEIDDPSRWLLHMGLYAFRREALRGIADLTAGGGGILDKIESLEQLAWLERGWAIAVVLVNHVCQGVDTEEDYRAFVDRWRNSARLGKVSP